MDFIIAIVIGVFALFLLDRSICFLAMLIIHKLDR